MSGFEGFPKEITAFFGQLTKNNTKEWFQEHKADYDAYVKHPSEEFVVEMGKRLKTLSSRINAVPKVNQSLFRLNRDTRFSKEKIPYKTNLGIWFWEGKRKRMECSGFYFHLDGEKLMLGTGMHIFPRDLLQPYRDAVVDKKNGPKLRKVADELAGQGYVVTGKHYKRIPSGYDESHRNAEFLLHNGLAAMHETKRPRELFSPGIVDYAFSHFEKMSPLHRWLITALG